MRIPLTIEALAPGGEGVGRHGELTVFVPWTAPGDRVVAEVPAPRPGAATAHGALVELSAPGEARLAPPCRHFGPGPSADAACGGCEWLHVAYPVQLAAKERALHEALRRIGKLEPGSYPARPIVPSPSPLRYRARAKFHHDRAAGRLVFFRRRSHEPVRLRECHLLEPGLDALREAVGPALAAARLSPREVALEWSEAAGRGAAWLLLPEVTSPVRTRAEALLREVPALQGLVLQAEGGQPVTAGDPVLRHARAPGRPEAGTQRSRPDVFQQANRGANARLVETALDLLAPEGEDVLELYCGAGNFTGPLSDRARSVSAIEVQGPALDLARADLGGRNVRFFAGDALALARAFGRESGPGARRFGAALLDPPREGARGIGPALRDLGVPRAVYVSCDPATFARDLRACVEAGYRVAAVVPVDMFPQTHHVEGVALLER
ncbi:class I SAM-dependent RNA methyltransferase [Anaeromyxobacter dehalogenans]|uniref:23S rRNA m(5)U-1939 methyltransferase n=1 Tax=Anaeromyxobacter dehalogenans (strain 2CP-C) TaxID=290397 RepID=Q2IKF4_ANADE|nr:class I SAM-dependent RNA methyltransferase [Anaeromyxobacter dehalogenans]ABC82130.1 23S rRNA m(5)U-1939 methyltransferase [Anaeromyxobacter dehalogenans 2CP-C]